jgi:hypothetical protein
LAFRAHEKIKNSSKWIGLGRKAVSDRLQKSTRTFVIERGGERERGRGVRKEGEKKN